MIIHEEPSPNSVSSPVSTAKDSRCYTVEDLMEMLLLPSHCLPSAEAERIPLVQSWWCLSYLQNQLRCVAERWHYRTQSCCLTSSTFQAKSAIL
jgi:hypothetical protein